MDKGRRPISLKRVSMKKIANCPESRINLRKENGRMAATAVRQSARDIKINERRGLCESDFDKEANKSSIISDSLADEQIENKAPTDYQTRYLEYLAKKKEKLEAEKRLLQTRPPFYVGNPTSHSKSKIPTLKRNLAPAVLPKIYNGFNSSAHRDTINESMGNNSAKKRDLIKKDGPKNTSVSRFIPKEPKITKSSQSLEEKKPERPGFGSRFDFVMKSKVCNVRKTPVSAENKIDVTLHSDLRGDECKVDASNLSSATVCPYAEAISNSIDKNSDLNDVDNRCISIENKVDVTLHSNSTKDKFKFDVLNKSSATVCHHAEANNVSFDKNTESMSANNKIDVALHSDLMNGECKVHDSNESCVTVGLHEKTIADSLDMNIYSDLKETVAQFVDSTKSSSSIDLKETSIRSPVTNVQDLSLSSSIDIDLKCSTRRSTRSTRFSGSFADKCSSSKKRRSTGRNRSSVGEPTVPSGAVTTITEMDADAYPSRDTEDPWGVVFDLDDSFKENRPPFLPADVTPKPRKPFRLLSSDSNEPLGLFSTPTLLSGSDSSTKSQKRRRKTMTPGELDIELVKPPEIFFETSFYEQRTPGSILKTDGRKKILPHQKSVRFDCEETCSKILFESTDSTSESTVAQTFTLTEQSNPCSSDSSLSPFVPSRRSIYAPKDDLMHFS